MSEAPPILLVHGAWHGAWCWAPLQSSLRQLGIDSVAIELPGHGVKRGSSWLVSWRQYVEVVREALAGYEVPPMVVGHSMGGGVITDAAGSAPALFGALVYVAAFVPHPGESVAALAKSDRSGLRPKPRLLRGEVYVEPRDGEAHFFHDCPNPERWSALLQPEPIRPVGAKVAPVAEGFAAVPRHFILCEKDRALSPAFQQRMIDRTAMTSVHRMNCGHSPFISDPDQLAAILSGIRNSLAPSRDTTA
jgi:pimeloyl-ACP methyl ester carboxylesterase